MRFILGNKIEMTQIFRDNGEVVPVTLIQAGPCTVAQVKDSSVDGYSAVQIGFGHKKKLSKALRGHLKDLSDFRYLKEFRIENVSQIKRGDKITVDTFEVGDIVKIVGKSKGRGFQGVVKRHGFKGSPATHGHKDQLRAPGSIGPTEPARVFPGMRMPGHMGDQQVSVKNLEIVQIDISKNILYIKGAVPGARNGLLMILGDGELKVNLSAVQPADSIESGQPDVVQNNTTDSDIKQNDTQNDTNNSTQVEVPNQENKQEEHLVGKAQEEKIIQPVKQASVDQSKIKTTQDEVKQDNIEDKQS